jgi:adenylylsulfate kinase-like enzyme
LNANIVTTQSMYSLAGIYIEEREAVHQDIIKFFTEGDTNITIPEAILTGGGSGAGKSTAVKLYFEIIEEHESVSRTLIDADEIKKHLPEYEKLVEEDVERMALILHDESSDISQKLI